MLRSSKILKYIWQYFFLFLGLSSIGNSLYNAFAEMRPWNTSETYFLSIPGLIFILVFFYLRDKFVVVELGSQKVKIYKDDEVLERTWLEVESVKRFLFSAPPIYILRLNDSGGFFIFCNSEISLFGDDSEMGMLIQKKKKDYDL